MLRHPYGFSVTAGLLTFGAACGGGGGGNTTGNNVDFSPTSNTSISGNANYKSVTIPAGVTVTVSADAVITVVGDVTVAGTLTAPCHALTVTNDGNLSVTGAVSNDCSDPTADGKALKLVGKSSYNLTGATITSSGDISVVNDPAGGAPATASALRIPDGNRPRATSYRCHLVNDTFNEKNGHDGTSASTGGTAGPSTYLGCGYVFSGQTGGSVEVRGFTVNGSNGGAGKDVSVTDATATGGDGAPPGSINISADGDIDISGTVNINGGNGGKGGDATSTGSPGTPGHNATAVGGKGAGLKPKNGNAPVRFVAGGSINQSGVLNVTLGTAGTGGAATATGGAGNPGNPGAKGGDATATGGNGGDSTPLSITATGAVTLSGTVNLSGGVGGGGGKATCTGGVGGAGNAPGAAGGVGGAMTCRGGTGGKGQPASLLGVPGDDPLAKVVLNSAGGKAGDATFSGGIGGVGGPACNPPGTGGPGGKGGDVTGGDGSIGTGTPNGGAGSTSVNGAANGGNGGDGLSPGAGGAAGGNGLSHGSGVTGPFNVTGSFIPGNPGAVCGSGISLTVTPPTQNGTRGGTGSVEATVTRLGTFTGAVNLAVKDPGGTVRGSGTIAQGNSFFDVFFNIPTDATLGSTTWTVEGSQTGITTVSKPFTVVVSQPSGTAVNGQYCGTTKQAIGVWFSDDGGTTWTQGTLTGQNFSHNYPASKAGLALLINTGSGFETDIYQFGASELVTEMLALCLNSTVGTNTVNGMVRGVIAGQHAFTTLGNSPAFANANGSADVPVQWQNVKSGTLDYIWVLMDASNTPLKTGIGRGFVVPTSSTLLIDYTTAATPDSRTVGASNVGTDSPFLASFYWTPTSLATISQLSTASGTLYNLANSQHQSGELFGVEAGASSSSDFRFVLSYNNSFSNQTLPLPNAITFTQSCLSTGSPVRFQVSGTAPAGLTQFFSVNASQSTRVVNIFETSTFNDGNASYLIGVPSLPGYPAGDGIQAGSSFNLSKTAEGATGGSAFGGPVSGMVLSEAQHNVTTSCP